MLGGRGGPYRPQPLVLRGPSLRSRAGGDVPKPRGPGRSAVPTVGRGRGARNSSVTGRDLPPQMGSPGCPSLRTGDRNGWCVVSSWSPPVPNQLQTQKSPGTRQEATGELGWGPSGEPWPGQTQGPPWDMTPGHMPFDSASHSSAHREGVLGKTELASRDPGLSGAAHRSTWAPPRLCFGLFLFLLASPSLQRGSL